MRCNRNSIPEDPMQVIEHTARVTPRPAHVLYAAAELRPSLEHLALALMDQIECGLVALDAQGTLLHANRAARRELKAGRALRLFGNRLGCSSGAQSEFAAALHDAAIRQRSRLLWIGEGDERLMLVAMPLRAEDGAPPTALLMLGRRSLCSPLGLEMMSMRYGLTLAERRVLRALVASQSAREIASDHGVALSTVRTQIQAIRQKVGVRNIDALLLRAAQVPPVGSWHEFGEAA
jgi:DNA-binding CsgD family transcriptional regulator